MTDGPEILPVVGLGEREGMSVSIVTDPSMVLESFRRGWHGTFEEAQRQYSAAAQDTDEYCKTNITEEERMIARQNLTKLAVLLFAQHTRAVAEAHGQVHGKPGSVTNTQVNIDARGNADLQARLAKMTDDELRAAIANTAPSAPDGSGTAQSE